MPGHELFDSIDMKFERIFEPGSKIILKMNGVEHCFPEVPKRSTERCETLDWFDVAKNTYGISHQESAVLNVAIQKLEKNWESQNLEEALKQTNDFMKDPIISEELFTKRLVKNRLDEELK